MSLSAAAILAIAPSLRAADTELDVSNGATDLTSSASYVGNGSPATNKDITFVNLPYSPANFTVNSSLAIGTLDDLSSTPLTISNTGGSADALTLSTLGNSVSGVAADLLYVSSAANLTLQDGSSALNLTLGIGGGNLDIAGSATINSVITSSGNFGFTKTGAGTLTLGGANTYTGPTILNAGTVVATESSGTPFGTANLTLNAATLNLMPGNTGSAVALTAASGASGLFTYGPGGTLILNANGNPSLSFTVGSGTGAAFARGTGGTLVLQTGGGIGSLGVTESFVVSGAAPTVTNGIVSPSIIGQTSSTDSSGTFLTYGVANTTGFSQFTAYTTQGSAFTPASASEIDDVTASVTVTPGATNPYALRVGNGNTLTIGGAATLTVASGGVILNGATITGSTLGFGTAEGLIYAGSSGASLISSIISGSGGLTMFGPGTLTLGATATTSIANTFTGSININGGTLAAVITQLNNADANSPIGGTGARVITLNGGTFQLLSGSALFNPNSTGGKVIAVGAGGGTLQIDAGGITLDDAGQFVSSAGGTLTKTGLAQLILGNGTTAFNVNGPIVVAAGSLKLLNSGTNALGSSPLVTVISGAELDINGLTANRPLSLSGTGLTASVHGALTSSSGNTATYSGPVALAAATSIGGTGAGGINISGIVSGSGSLTKIDNANLALSSATGNTFTGGTTLTGGTLTLTNTSGSAAGPGNVVFNPAGGVILASGAAGSMTGAVIGSTSGTTATIAPGGFYSGNTLNTFGSLTVGALTLTSNATRLAFDLSTPTGTNDLLTVTGVDAFTATGTNKIPILFGQAPTDAGTYHLISFNQDGNGTISTNSFSVGSSGNGRLSYMLQVDPGTGNQQFLDLIVSGSSAPIPASAPANFIGTTTPTSWLTPSNWSTNPVVPGQAGDAVTFNNGTSVPGMILVTLDGQQRVGSLAFNNSGSTSFNLAPGTNPNLTPALFFDNTPNSAAATLVNSSNNNVISAPVTLVSATNVTVTGSTAGQPNVLTISGKMNGTVALTLASPSTGVLALSGVNSSFSGPIAVQSGTLRAGSSTAFGTGTTTVTAGATADLNGSGLTSGSFSLNGTGVGGLGALINSSSTAASTTGAVALASATTLGGIGSYTLTGLVSGSGALTKTGIGNITFTNNANTDTGAVVINAGTLTLAGANGATGTIQAPSITVNSGGTLVLTNGDTIGYTTGRNVLTINSGGAVLNNGSAKRDTILNTITMTGGILGGTSTGDSTTTNGGAYSFNVATALNATSDANGVAALVNAPSVSLQTSTTFNVTRGVATPDSDLTVASAIIPYAQGSSGLTKTGNGIMTLTGASTYTGATALNAGTTVLNNTAGNVLGATAITVGNNTSGNSTLLVKRNNTIGTATGGSLTISGGDASSNGQGTLSLVDSSINTLTLTNLTTAANSLVLGSAVNPAILNLELGTTAGSSDKIVVGSTTNKLVVNAGGTVNGTAGVGAIINIVPMGAIVPGTYTLLSYGSQTNTTASGGFAFSNGTQTEVLNGVTLMLINAATTETLNVTSNTGGGTLGAVPAIAYFQGSVDNNWNTIDANSFVTNFTSDSAGTTNTFQLPGAATDVHFYATNANTANLATNLGQNFTIKSLTLDGNTVTPAASQNVSIASGGTGGNTLTITPAAATTGITMNAGSGSLTITAPLVLGAAQTWTNSSSNPLTISGPSITANAFALTVAGSGNTALSAPITGTAGLTKTGAGTLAISTASPSFSGGVTIAAGTLVATVDNAVGPANTITFGDGTTSNVGALNLTDGSLSAVALSGRSNSATNVNTVTIGVGKTLTLGSGVTLGLDVPAATGATTTKMAISGAGTLSITGGGVQVGTSQTVVNSTNSSNGVLDLTGLTGGFTASVGNFNAGFGNDDSGTILLSNTSNAITATTINVGNSNNNNAGPSANQLTFGTGSNTIRTDTINVGISKASGTISFASTAANSPGTVTIANAAGTGGAAVNVGSSVTGTGAVFTGTLDLRGHVSTVNASTVTVGNTAIANSGTASGILSFDSGDFNATALNLGARSAAAAVNGTTTASTNSATLNIGGGNFSVSGTTTIAANTQTGTSFTGNVIGTINLTAGTLSTGSIVGATKNSAGKGSATSNINVGGSGTLLVNPGGVFSLATAGTGTVGTATGSLTITGNGSVTSNVDITDGNGGTATTAVTLTSGLLDLKGHSLGAAGALIDTLAFQGGTLQNVGQINNGAGLTKTTTATMILDGTNGYTGPTNVNGGTLLINGSLTSAAAPVIVNANATLGGGGSVAAGTMVAASATLAPSAGSSAPLATPLTLTGGVTFTDNTSSYSVKLASPANASTPSYDRTIVGGAGGGTATLNGATLIVNDAAYASAGINQGDQFFIIDGAAGSTNVVGTFASGAVVTGTSGSLYSISYNMAGDRMGTGNDVVLTAVPEPVALSLVGLSALGLLSRRRRRGNSTVPMVGTTIVHV